MQLEIFPELTTRGFGVFRFDFTGLGQSEENFQTLTSLQT